MLNHGLQMNNPSEYFPAYPEVKITRITIFKRTIVFTLQCHSKCNEESSTFYNEILQSYFDNSVLHQNDKRSIFLIHNHSQER